MPDGAEDVTRLLRELSDGGRDAFDEVFSLVYAELRRLAESRLDPDRALLLERVGRAGV